MKIIGITPYNLQMKQNNNPKTQSKNTNVSAPPPIYPSKLPNTAVYLGFTGGYSLDLAKTVEKLDVLAIKKPKLYPPNIREWAGMVLEEGNKAGDTLIDVHKKFYSGLKECFSLDEAKKKFPEFDNVLSDSEVEFSKGTFFEAFKEGKFECFDKDEDLSLQLMKLYWGDGFSLTDLQKYTATLEKPQGFNLSYTLNKLNIPLSDRDYGHILKFSDAEYNTRLTREMTAKRLETMDKKAQLSDGEPLFIKRGPMSAEHREHISEGLKKYYQENPEKLYDISERQKKFYEENPERADILRRVANKAWNIFGADRIKDALSKFMKSNGVKDFKTNDLENPIVFSKQRSQIMKKFWGSNEWARKSFSKNMEFAWKKVKEENEMSYIIEVTPNGFKDKLYKWAKEKGYNIRDLKFSATYYPHKPELNDFSQNNAISKYTREFLDDYPEDESSKMANTYLLALLNINSDVSKLNLSRASTTCNQLVQTIKKSIKESLFVDPNLPFEKNQFKKLNANDAQRIFSILQQHSMDLHEQKIIEMFNKHLNKAYDYLDKSWKPGSPLKISPYGMDL